MQWRCGQCHRGWNISGWSFISSAVFGRFAICNQEIQTPVWSQSAEEYGECEVFHSMCVGVKQGLNHPLHYKTMLHTANAANNHRPVHSPHLSNAFLMDSGSSIYLFFWITLIRTACKGKISTQKKQRTQTKSNKLTRRAAEFAIKAKRTAQEKLRNMTSVRCKRQSTSRKPSCSLTQPSPSLWSQTQPIPSIRAKAPGTMAAVKVGSTPEDSSVREVEQTIASNTTLPRLPLI